MASSSYSNSTLEQIITKNNFNSSFSDQLYRLARNDSLFPTLYLQNNGIGPKGAASIAQALSSNSVLTELNLQNNQIGDTGATAIA